MYRMRPDVLIFRYRLVVFFCFTFLSSLFAQKDTLRLTLPKVEKIFLDSNLQLLAQKYSIDATKALVIQAKLFPNPNIAYSRGLYSGSYHKYILLTDSENSVQVSQLILLAGKRNKQIKIAKANVALAEYQFFDLLRTLKYSLRSTFFNVYYLRQSARVYSAEINALRQIVTAFNEQHGKGYISEREVIRIKAQLYSFQSEYNDLINQINDTESELKLLLLVKSNVYIDPIIDTAAVNKLDPFKYTLDTLLNSAYRNRTDLLIAKENTDINKLTYNYQKALAIPDLTLNAGYDQAGGFARNYYGIGASIDLPFFNRNQGNIKMAKAMIDNTIALQKNTEFTVSENVNRSLEKALAENKLFQEMDPKFSNDFERLMQEVVLHYMKRDIGILDFLDFYDSYKQNVLQFNAIRYNRIQAFEDLNFYTATNFYNQ